MLARILPLLASFQGSPADFGREELALALREAGLEAGRIEVGVSHRGPPESFSIRFEGEKALVDGADETGAMYGAIELAERVERLGAAAFEGEEIRGEPYLRDRGLNLFLTLPWDYEKNDTDYDLAALVDPKRWWFHDEGYWRTLLDPMARSRLDLLPSAGAIADPGPRPLRGRISLRGE